MAQKCVEVNPKPEKNVNYRQNSRGVSGKNTRGPDPLRAAAENIPAPALPERGGGGRSGASVAVDGEVPPVSYTHLTLPTIA